jgi:subtilisin family serine protease
MEYVIQQKKERPGTPMVVNMSLGATFSPAMNLGVKRLVENGIVVIVSAGNEDDDACKYSPASSQDAITVGSVDKVRICFSRRIPPRNSTINFLSPTTEQWSQQFQQLWLVR